MAPSLLEKPFTDAIQWTDPDPGVLAYRFPMEDREIQRGTQLTVDESQIAALVSAGRFAGLFGPGRHTLSARTQPGTALPSEVFFFSTRIHIDQRWGTGTPITVYAKELGGVRIRVYGVYTYRISDPRAFLTQISDTNDVCYAEDLERRLRSTIAARMVELLSPADLAVLEAATSHAELAVGVSEALRPEFAGLGIALDSFAIQSLSIPEELQRMYTQREAACLTCNSTIPRSAKYCPECGKPQR